ncbi:MAG: GNAT family N-acetyltransferase, partial [Porticoccaceae bacterium]
LDSGELLGACGLCYIDWVSRNADFSIYIGYEGLYIDTCFAPDAAKVMIRYAFDELQLHRLWAEIYDFDKPKMTFFDQLGFQQEGLFRNSHWTEGAWHNSVYYGLLQTDPIVF